MAVSEAQKREMEEKLVAELSEVGARARAALADVHAAIAEEFAAGMAEFDAGEADHG